VSKNIFFYLKIKLRSREWGVGNREQEEQERQGGQGDKENKLCPMPHAQCPMPHS